MEFFEQFDIGNYSHANFICKAINILNIAMSRVVVDNNALFCGLRLARVFSDDRNGVFQGAKCVQ